MPPAKRPRGRGGDDRSPRGPAQDKGEDASSDSQQHAAKRSKPSSSLSLSDKTKESDAPSTTPAISRASGGGGGGGGAPAAGTTERAARSLPVAPAAAPQRLKRGAPGREDPRVAPEELQSAGEAACNALRTVLQRLHAAGPAGADPSTEHRELVTAGLLLITDIKRVVRSSHRNWREAEAEAFEDREKVDARYLQLQNVLFEKMHVQKEIERCEQFRSRHRDLGLAPAAEALGADAIAEVAGDQHKLMLLRLDVELKERQRLRAECERVAANKAAAERAVESKRDELLRLPQLLQGVLTAAQPVVKFFNFSDSGAGGAMEGEADSSTFLPTPLYLLYSCLHDYREMSTDAYDVAVTGDVKAARDPAVLKLWETSHAISSASSDAAPTASVASGAMQVDDDDEAEGKASRHGDHGTSADEPLDESVDAARARLLRAHPLSVQLDFKGSGCMSLCFSYLVELRVVTVQIVGMSDAESPLHYLYPDDTGVSLPTEGSALRMEKYGLSSAWVEHAATLGRPYKWAQPIAGCAVDGDVVGASVDARQRRSNMVQLVHDVATFARATASLASQLETLAKSKLTIPSDVEQALFPLPSKAVLKAWTRVAEDGEMVRYEATLAHESNALKIDVTVSKGYPRVPPRFAVAMVANGSDGDANTSARDPNMDAMEREVNVHFDELAAATDPSLLLTLQLRRLQMCFDVYSECAAIGASKDHVVGKMFERCSERRNGVCPFVFDKKLGMFVHRDNH